MLGKHMSYVAILAQVWIGSTCGSLLFAEWRAT
jgi:hypothetical protein